MIFKNRNPIYYRAIAFLILRRLIQLRYLQVIQNLYDLYLLDTPHGFTWKGVFMDADLRTVETVPSVQTVQTDDTQKTFMQLSGLQGSVLEHKVFEDDWQVPSVSTANLFQYAQSIGAPIITIDKTNILSSLPALPFDDNIKEDIQNSVNQNLVVRIPTSYELSAITYKDWTGVGYIKEDLNTGESGYMLSGMIAGGMTAVTPEAWANQDLKTILSSPYSPKPNTDPASAVKILKITATDELSGTVGEPLNQGLLVFVLDKNNKPVKGAKVNFFDVRPQ